MARREKVESLAAIDRAEEPGVQDIESVGRARVRVDLAEIPGTLTKTEVVIDLRPVIAAVVGLKDAAFLRLDDRVNAIGIGARNGHADAPENALRQTVSLQMLPGVAAIGRAIKPAPFTAAGEKPRLPPHLPERGEQSVRIMRVENDVDRAGVLVFAQDFRPGLAAIGRAKNSALVVRAISMSEGRDKNDVRILRMHDESRRCGGCLSSRHSANCGRHRRTYKRRRHR